MELETFFPHRLAIVADAVSRSIAEVYGERFDLSRDEWRVLTALPRRGIHRTGEVIARSHLDKGSVSRALTCLEAKGCISRSSDPEDGRGYLIQMLPTGRTLLKKMVPAVQARAKCLLDELNEAERKILDAALDKVLHQALNQLRRE
ncbi:MULTISPECIES: MarR family winged helix-turn-helix transcriptional regulator [unclassified Burkholderia]|uniref:MarR family winged helix-turn-helix transcriptional regulator n=1 Tax=unclassified Burkholderia TaxID=2613784 RepID=UPI0005DCB909|nr:MULTISPECIES: MarR family transcriptional regulator [unclassified Burkholderia]TGN98724.1 MarR family transcriptional regulator [Burkholderia sp. USMB20]